MCVMSWHWQSIGAELMERSVPWVSDVFDKKGEQVTLKGGSFIDSLEGELTHQTTLVNSIRLIIYKHPSPIRA